MQATLAEAYEMQRTTMLWVPAGTMIDAKAIEGPLGAILTVTTAPTYIVPDPVCEPYHVGGCI